MPTRTGDLKNAAAVSRSIAVGGGQARAPQRRRAVLLVFLLCLAQPALGGTATWDVLAEDLPTPVRALSLVDDVGWAVGDGGLLLQLDPETETWNDVPSPTDQDLLDVVLRTPDHGLAVGRDGVILDYDRRWQEQDGHPANVVSAYASSGTGPTFMRRIEWQIPLSLVGITGSSTFGLGVTAASPTASAHHPPDLDDADPLSTDAVRFTDIGYGSPTVDGHQEAVWTTAVWASYPAADVVFSLYLLRDTTNLYVLVAATDLDDVHLQVHQQHAPRLGPKDHRFAHEDRFADRRSHHAVTPEPSWALAVAPGALGVSALYGAAFLSETEPLAVGTGGALVVGAAADWALETLVGAPTLRAVDVRDEVAYLAGGTGGGSDAPGQRGAAGGPGSRGATDATDTPRLYRYSDGAVDEITVPAGPYTLYDIDLTTCRAAGSGGHMLRCVNDDPDVWTVTVLDSDHTLKHLMQADDGNAWVAGHDDDGAGVLWEEVGTTWKARAVPGLPAEVTALAYGLKGPLLASLDGWIQVLRRHAPVVTSMPTSTTGYEGQELHIPFSATDKDNDVIDIHVHPPADFPDVEIDVVKIARDLFELVFIPPFDGAGEFDLRIDLTDGDFTTSNGTTVIIIDVNAPPFWDPHPDVVIPHSVPWTTTATAHDPDGDPLLLTAPTLPAGALFTDLGTNTGQIDWTPGPGQVGTHPIQLRADDGALTADLWFNVKVVDNQPPEITHVGPGNPGTCVAGPWYSGTITFLAEAVDPEGGPITYSWHFEDTNTLIVGNPVSHTFTQVGNWTVTLTATDDVGMQAVRTLIVRVDDCIRVHATLDLPCVDILHQATGTIQMWDHTGAPANGTYKIAVWWNSITGTEQQTFIEGQIVNGYAPFVVPFDLRPVPANEPTLHSLYATGHLHDTAHGDTESMTASLRYTVSVGCRLLGGAPLY